MHNVRQEPGTRIVFLDALRGFALLGILLVHFNFWFVVSPMPDSLANADFGMLSKAAELLNSVFIKGKFYFLFSCLFGISFYLQTAAFSKKAGNPDLLFFRRAVGLFFLGFIHNDFWAGDILETYAVLMLPTLVLRRLPANVLLVIGILFIADFPNLLREGYAWVAGLPQDAPGTLHYEFLHLIESGNISQIIAYNASHLHEKIVFLLLSGRLSVTFGFLLLGLAIGKKGYLSQLNFEKKKTATVFASAFAVLVVFQLAGTKLNHMDAAHLAIPKLLVVFLQNAAAITAYSSLLALAYISPRLATVTDYLSKLGKMSLTNYLVQTVIALGLFYGFGLGLYLKTTPAENLGIALALFVLQALFSNWWLKQFIYGPVEWLLRLVTLWQWYPIKKPAAKA